MTNAAPAVTPSAPEGDRPASLAMTDVRKVFRAGDNEVVALDDVNLTVGAEEIVALVGPSGSGKTTLCSIAGGLLSATAGSVVVAGEELVGRSESELTDFRRTTVGFVFQTVNLVPFLTARENLVIVDELAGRRGNRRRAHGARRPAAGRARPGRPGRQPAGPAVGRSASAGGDRAGVDERTGARAVRRADLGARLHDRRAGGRAHPRGDAGPANGRHHRHPRRADHPLRRSHRAYRRRRISAS